MQSNKNSSSTIAWQYNLVSSCPPDPLGSFEFAKFFFKKKTIVRKSRGGRAPPSSETQLNSKALLFQLDILLLFQPDILLLELLGKRILVCPPVGDERPLGER